MSDAPEQPTPTETAAAQPTFPLLSYLNGLVDELRLRVVVALTEWEPEAVHQSRVATRRMKSALDLMEIVLSKRPRRRFASVMRKLRRRLGPLRDADVMIEHLKDLGDDGRHAAATAWLVVRFNAERDASRKRSAKGKRPAAVVAKLGGWAPVQQEIADAREALDSLLAESLHLQLDAFAEQAGRLTEAATGAEAAAAVEPQDPHELRISGKALRYTLEMAGVHGHDLPGSLTKTFKKMQDALGLWHDYVVLAERATHAALDEQLAHHAPELMSDLFEFVREVLGRATENLSEFKRLWSEQGDAVAKAIRTAFPLTYSRGQAPPNATGESAGGATAINAPQTDHGPSGSAQPGGSAGAPPAAAGDA